jgi:hypothetical protein
MEISQKTATLIEAVHQFRYKGLWGLQIMKTWMERSVQPLGWREFPMFEYRGLRDPSRLLNREDSENEVERCMHHVTGLPLEDILMEVTVEPYCQANPRPGVSYCDLLYVFFIVGGLLPCPC